MLFNCFIILLQLSQCNFKGWYQTSSIANLQIRLTTNKLTYLLIQIQNWKYGVYYKYQRKYNSETLIDVKWDLVSPNNTQDIIDSQGNYTTTYQLIPIIIRQGHAYIPLFQKFSNAYIYIMVQSSSYIELQVSCNSSTINITKNNLNCQRKSFRIIDQHCPTQPPPPPPLINNLPPNTHFIADDGYQQSDPLIKLPAGKRSGGNCKYPFYCPFQGMRNQNFTCIQLYKWKNQTTCQICPDNKYANNNNFCINCSFDYCKICNSYFCLQCIKGYYLSNFQCFKCQKYCVNCFSQQYICSQCIDRVLIQNRCVCDEGCQTCNTYQQCTSCNTSFYLQITVNKCKCNGTCKFCTNTSPTYCTDCIDLYVLDINTNNCTCNFPCLTCFNSLTNCTSCVLIQNETHILKNNNCVSCGYGCIQCTDKEQCLQVIDHYFINDQLKPQQCLKLCQICRNKEICLQCYNDQLQYLCLCEEFIYIDSFQCVDVRKWNQKLNISIYDESIYIEFIFHSALTIPQNLQLESSIQGFVRDNKIYFSLIKYQDKQVSLSNFNIIEFKNKFILQHNNISINIQLEQKTIKLPIYTNVFIFYQITNFQKKFIQYVVIIQKNLKNLMGIGIVHKVINLIYTINLYSFHIMIKKASPQIRIILKQFFYKQPFSYSNFSFNQIFKDNNSKQQLLIEDIISNNNNLFISCFDVIINLGLFILFSMIFKFISVYLKNSFVNSQFILIKIIFQNQNFWKEGFVIVYSVLLGKVFFLYFLNINQQFRINSIQKLIQCTLFLVLLIVSTFLFILYCIKVLKKQSLQQLFMFKNKQSNETLQVNINLKILYFLTHIKYIGFAIYLSGKQITIIKIIPCLCINILYLSYIMFIKNYFRSKIYLYLFVIQSINMIFFQLILLFILIEVKIIYIKLLSLLAVIIFLIGIWIELIRIFFQIFLLPISYVIWIIKLKLIKLKYQKKKQKQNYKLDYKNQDRISKVQYRLNKVLQYYNE